MTSNPRNLALGGGSTGQGGREGDQSQLKGKQVVHASGGNGQDNSKDKPSKVGTQAVQTAKHNTHPSGRLTSMGTSLQPLRTSSNPTRTTSAQPVLMSSLAVQADLPAAIADLARGAGRLSVQATTPLRAHPESARRSATPSEGLPVRTASRQPEAVQAAHHAETSRRMASSSSEPFRTASPTGHAVRTCSRDERTTFPTTLNPISTNKQRQNEPGLRDDVLTGDQDYEDDSDTSESTRKEAHRLRNLEQTVQNMAGHIQLLATHLVQQHNRPTAAYRAPERHHHMVARSMRSVPTTGSTDSRTASTSRTAGTTQRVNPPARPNAARSGESEHRHRHEHNLDRQHYRQPAHSGSDRSSVFTRLGRQARARPADLR